MLAGMETNKQGIIRCVYCDALLKEDPEFLLRWRDPNGFGACPDGGWHKPVLTVEAIA